MNRLAMTRPRMVAAVAGGPVGCRVVPVVDGVFDRCAARRRRELRTRAEQVADRTNGFDGAGGRGVDDSGALAAVGPVGASFAVAVSADFFRGRLVRPVSVTVSVGVTGRETSRVAVSGTCVVDVAVPGDIG